MKLKSQANMRFGLSILVLTALTLMTRSALAAPQPSPGILPNSDNLHHPDVVPAQSCPAPQTRPGEFTKSVGNPVLNTGTLASWDENGVMSPSTLWSSGTYRMWYSGSDASFTSAIGYATSTDGANWNKWASNPVLVKGAPGTWEAASVGFASVIPDGGGYKMWYTGTGAGKRQVGYATSADGITWSKYAGNPVVAVGAAGQWDAPRVSNPTVVKVGSTYHMWYSSAISPAGGIGHATSTDGINWTKDSGNPVIPGGSAAWDDTPFAPFVLYDGCWFQMWYSGCDPAQAVCQTGYARSLDGFTWTKRGVVLPLGPSGAFDSELTGYPSLMLGVPYFRMWYTGQDVDGIYRIGLAMAIRLDKELFLPLLKR